MCIAIIFALSFNQKHTAENVISPWIFHLFNINMKITKECEIKIFCKQYFPKYEYIP